MATSIITCPSCSKRNRMAPRAAGVPRCANCHTLLPWLVDARTDDFDDEVRASVPVLIDLWAPWCGPCKVIEPVLGELARSRAGQLKVVRVNVDDERVIAQRFRVTGIPLLVLTRDGREVDRLTGALPRAELEAWLVERLGAEAGAGA